MAEIELESLYRYSLEDYHRLIESGGFDEDTRVELIEGLLVEMRPKSPAHENALEWLTEWLVMGVDRDRYAVRVQSAVTLDASEPEPDVAVVPRDVARPYHPATAALIIEVAVSSLRHDLRVKPPLYARAGIPDYWVLDLDGRRVVAHTQPGADGYGVVTVVPAGEPVMPTTPGLPTLEVDAVLAAAER